MNPRQSMVKSCGLFVQRVGIEFRPGCDVLEQAVHSHSDLQWVDPYVPLRLPIAARPIPDLTEKLGVKVRKKIL